MDDKGWFTVKQVISAWVYGCIEAANSNVTGVYVPRYLETVGAQLAQHLRGLAGGDIFEASPRQVGVWLAVFNSRHAVVKKWELDHDAATTAACSILVWQASQ